MSKYPNWFQNVSRKKIVQLSAKGNLSLKKLNYWLIEIKY